MALNAGETLANGQYCILGQLGRGGFGFVYQAEDTLMNETVAIKELIPGLIDDEVILKRFIQEARASLRLTHPNIVRVYNVFADRGNYYIVMEYLPGGSLEEWMERGTVGVEQAIRVMADVCAGLEYAHEKGVVHCDIKPGNVLFAAEGTAKVADFGVAHVSEELMTRSWQSASGFAAGTMLYMAPEQLDGVRDDPRVDIYALGAMLYQLLTGRPYLDFRLPARNISDQVHNASQIKEGQPVPPSAHNRAIPKWLDTVILKALAKQPAGRYGSASELAEALQAASGMPHDVPVRPRPVEPPTIVERPIPLPRRRSVVPWAGAGLGAIGLVVAAMLIFGRGLGPVTPTPNGEATATTLLSALQSPFSILNSQLSMGLPAPAVQAPTKRIGIEAGHGGTDSGALSCDRSVRETDITIAVAHKAAELLRDKGYQVDVFRDGDPAALPKSQMRGYKADAFVALHTDFCPNPSTPSVPTGFKVSCYGGAAGSGLNGSGDASDRLVQTLWEEYGQATGLSRDTADYNAVFSVRAAPEVSPTPPPSDISALIVTLTVILAMAATAFIVLNRPSPSRRTFTPARRAAPFPSGAGVRVMKDYGPGEFVGFRGGVLGIGRDPHNELVLSDDRVSRNHAQIRQEAGGYVIHDQGSTNGTFVNG